MKDLKLASTESTPSVFFQKCGILEISGKVIPNSDTDFWNSIGDWLTSYFNNPAPNTLIRFKIDYLNTSSSKEILKMLYRLNEIMERGFHASVEWEYAAGDHDMLEVGRDYAHLVKVPFQYCEMNELSC